MTAVKKVFIALSAVLVWTAIPAASANAVSVGQSCAKTTLGTRVSIRINKKRVIVVCRNVAGRKKWIRAAVQTITTSTTSTSTTSTTTTVPEPVISYTDVVDPVDPTLHTITIEGMQPRTYYLNIPPKYTPGTPVPLLIGFHGLGGSASSFENSSLLKTFSQDMNFILVLPNGWRSEEGQQRSWNAGNCCYPARNEIDDVGFVQVILKSLMSNYAIDTSRIWAIGFSNGGMMSYRLACELSEKITAIGVGAGALMTDTCRPPRPVSVIHIHGNLDEAIPIDGGGRFNAPPAPSSMKEVNSANSCSNMTYGVTIDLSSETLNATCDDGTEAKLVNYLDQGHEWTIYWTKEILRFLFAHPRK